MRVDGDSQAGRVLYVTGRYEPDVTAEIKRLAGSGDLVVDGGAHIGFFTLLASFCVGPTGQVMAFEPSSPTAEILRANVQLNACRNVTIVEAALSDQSGTGVLAQKSSTETGQATLRSIGGAASRTAIRLATLDELLFDDNRPVALVKLDLEGAEFRALLGMKRILARDRPALIIEVTDAFLKQAGASAVELYGYLADLGYLAHVIEWNAVRRVDSADMFLRCGEQFNALFTASPGRHAQRPGDPTSRGVGSSFAIRSDST